MSVKSPTNILLHNSATVIVLSTGRKVHGTICLERNCTLKLTKYIYIYILNVLSYTNPSTAPADNNVISVWYITMVTLCWLSWEKNNKKGRVFIFCFYFQRVKNNTNQFNSTILANNTIVFTQRDLDFPTDTSYFRSKLTKRAGDEFWQTFKWLINRKRK
jgi:hypothetical protein